MPNIDYGIRAQVVTLKAWGFPTSEIASRTGLIPRTINRIYDQAIERGFDPESSPTQVLLSYVEDAPRSGCPRKQEKASEAVLEHIRTNRYTREQSSFDIADTLSDLDISATMVWRILRMAGLKKTKPIRKPGLSEPAKAKRLEFCLRY